MRIKRFDMTSEFLKQILSPGRKDFETTRNALPVDAELVRIHVDPFESTPGLISLFYTSQDFPDLPEATVPQSERIEFTQHIHDDEPRFEVFS